jgi:multidrug efflux pump
VLVTPTDNLQVRVTGALKTVKDLEELELRANGTTSFRLGDFATIKREYQDPPGDKMRFNGKEVIGLGVSMEKGGNIILLGKGHGKDRGGNEGQAAGRYRAGTGVGPAARGHGVGGRVRAHPDRGGADRAGVSFLALGLHTKPKLRLDVRPGLVVALTIPLVLAMTFLFMRMLLTSTCTRSRWAR